MALAVPSRPWGVAVRSRFSPAPLILVIFGTLGPLIVEPGTGRTHDPGAKPTLCSSAGYRAINGIDGGFVRSAILVSMPPRFALPRWLLLVAGRCSTGGVSATWRRSFVDLVFTGSCFHVLSIITSATSCFRQQTLRGERDASPRRGRWSQHSGVHRRQTRTRGPTPSGRTAVAHSLPVFRRSPAWEVVFALFVPLVAGIDVFYDLPALSLRRRCLRRDRGGVCGVWLAPRGAAVGPTRSGWLTVRLGTQ